MTGFNSFESAAITITRIELAHRVHKNQFALGSARSAIMPIAIMARAGLLRRLTYFDWIDI